MSTCSEEDEELEVETDKEDNEVENMNAELESINLINVRADKVEQEQLKDSHKFLEKAHMSVFSTHHGRYKMIARLSSRCY